MGGIALQNGHWLDAAGTLREGTLLVREGRIRIGARPDSADRIVDATGALILPGAIDAHTHLREPGQEYKEGIESGTRAALAGGVTTVLDMPNNVPPITSAERLAAKAALFRAKSRVNWGLHVQAPVDDAARLGPYAAAKVYLAKSSSLPAVRGAEALRAILLAHRRVAVHAEDESCFLPAERFGVRSHHLQRPREAVIAALTTLEQALVSLPHPERPRIVLCHASTADEVAWLRRMKASGHDVWGETCPHYLLLDQVDYECEGARLKVNPPLRSPEDVAAVREGLAEGAIDFVSSDHAPHSPQEKAEEASAPSGIPGIEWFLPSLLSLVDAGALKLGRLAQVASLDAARCYGIGGRGAIEEGAWADLAVVSKRRRAPRAVITRAGYEPYSKIALAWTVDATVVSGELAFAAGEFLAGATGLEVLA